MAGTCPEPTISPVNQLQNCEGEKMQSAYAVWIGQAVVLQVAAADLRVPLRGIIVGETDEAIQFRVEQTWDIDIYKSMILAVEQDRWARVLVN